MGSFRHPTIYTALVITSKFELPNAHRPEFEAANLILRLMCPWDQPASTYQNSPELSV